MTGFSAMQSILAQQKPEAVYFFAEHGRRTAQPWFLAFNAAVECVPVMVPGDLQKAGPAVEEAVKTYGHP